MKAKKTKRNRLETAEASEGLARLWMVGSGQPGSFSRGRLRGSNMGTQQFGHESGLLSAVGSRVSQDVCPLHKNWISEIILI